MNPVFLPALGALCVLAFDLLVPMRGGSGDRAREVALSGIRLGLLAVAVLASVVVVLRWSDAGHAGRSLALDPLALFGIGWILVAAVLVLSLSLTHFGMARCRPAEPIALLLFSWSGAMAAIAAQHLLVLFVALELCWLPMITMVALDSRRLSSSESSLKMFFAHAFASLVFAQGLAFVFGATGGLELDVLRGTAVDPGARLAFDVGFALLLLGLVARAAIAPFHPWAPDAYEGAPSFIAAHLATAAQGGAFFVLLRVLHVAPDPLFLAGPELSAKLPLLLAIFGGAALVLGHAMALVQVGLRRLIGWLAVGQTGFLTLALVDARGDGAHAMVLGVIALGLAITGVMATFSSMSHHDRACESIGDLAGLIETSPLRAGLLGLFLLSLGGMPGTIGFAARYRILAALDVEDGVGRVALWVGLLATLLALIAVGRPLVAMLQPAAGPNRASRALSNEQFVLLICAVGIVYFGVMPVSGETNMAGQVAVWIDRAVEALRR